MSTPTKPRATSRPPAALPPVAVGIDAGGSRTRARAVRHGSVVHEGEGGPGNPVMSDAATIRASYRAAVAGCPAAGRVAACVSGAGGAEPRAQVEALLAELFPGADVRVAPDCVAAFLAAPPGTDLCVVAGTGSVVCSRGADGGFLVSGGRGWVLGDHGGAARLGRAALEHYVADVGAVPASFAAAPLLSDAGLGILLDTGPEVLTGSTRLKAGTAQKLALNRVTTAAMVLAGRVAGNHMIDLTGSNAKLRARAVRIVTDLAEVDRCEAARRLEASGWSVRSALRARTGPGPA